MDHSIIELACEWARVAANTPRSPEPIGHKFPAGPKFERSQTHPNAGHAPARLQRWLATNGETNLYLACTLLFAMGVLLALSGMPVGVVWFHDIGGQCHGQR